MVNDYKSLKLLSILHYCMTVLQGLLLVVPTILIWFGIQELGSPGLINQKDGTPAPPFLGWTIVSISVVGFIFILAVTIATWMSARFIKRKQHYHFSFALACVELLTFPLGTALGIFTIIVLLDKQVKELYSASQ